MRVSLHEPLRVPARFWELDAVCAALDQRAIGALFRLLRKYCGASQTRIGIAVELQQGTVSLIMNDRQAVTSITVLERIADGLDMPNSARRRLGLAPLAPDEQGNATSHGLVDTRSSATFTGGGLGDLGWSESGLGVVTEVPANTGLTLPWTAAGAINATAEVLVLESGMDRRVFISLSGSALTEPALDWLIAPPAGDVARPQEPAGMRRVLDGYVDCIEQLTDQLRRMDDQFGGGAVLGLARNQVGHVLDLLRNYSYSESVGIRLHGAAAESLRLAGWSSFDAGRHGQAQRYWLAALRAAHAAGDRSIGANILAYMSLQARHLEQYGEAIKLAEAARQGYGGQSPRVSAMLNVRAASAYASAGEAKPYRSAADLAYNALRGQPATSGEPAWCHWIGEAFVNNEVGASFMRLEDWGRAQNHLKTAIQLYTDPASRDAVWGQAELATVYARQGDVEQACQVGEQVMDILAAKVDSEGCVGQLRRLQTALSPYRKVAAVNDFNERVRKQLGVPA
jgi:tetratricopeptide (TPR) repeat protein/transcriptional regulator with XRE-family HTH domain